MELESSHLVVLVCTAVLIFFSIVGNEHSYPLSSFSFSRDLQTCVRNGGIGGGEEGGGEGDGLEGEVGEGNVLWVWQALGR